MIESGVITRTVELGENIQLNIDFESANTLAGALNVIFAKGLHKLLTEEEADRLGALNDALAEAVNKYNYEFENNELKEETC